MNLAHQSGQMFAHFRPAYREIYYNDRRTGVGAVQDSSMDIMNLGESLPGSIDRLVADVEHCLIEGMEVEDTVHVMTRQGGILGAYTRHQ